MCRLEGIRSEMAALLKLAAKESPILSAEMRKNDRKE